MVELQTTECELRFTVPLQPRISTPLSIDSLRENSKSRASLAELSLIVCKEF